jgi:hypothetical protein
MRYFLRIFRAVFLSEPAWLDGPFIAARVREGASWDEALAERSRMNCLAKLRWHEGDLDWYRDLSMRHVAVVVGGEVMAVTQ